MLLINDSLRITILAKANMIMPTVKTSPKCLLTLNSHGQIELSGKKKIKKTDMQIGKKEHFR